MFGMVLGGFQKDLEGFGRISGGSGEGGPVPGCQQGKEGADFQAPYK